jgi:hypothetical protein
MKRSISLTLLVLGLGAVVATGVVLQPTRNDQPSMVVYKAPTCGCCVKWVEHMENAGFEVETRDMRDMGAIKSQLGVPRAVGSCHTAVIDGYIIEGHVSPEHVERLLEERPKIRGIAVPGMPIGSPGMEGPNAQPYDVVTFDENGLTGVFARVEL